MNKPLKCFWWSEPCKEAVYNFGDLITPLLLNAYGLIEYAEADRSNGSKVNLVIVGSVLNPFWNHHDFDILGAGLLREETKTFPEERTLALRGELTKKCLGITKDIPLGDPALLVSKVLPMPADVASTEKPIGILPHWKNYASPRLDVYRNNPRYKIINPKCEAPFAVREICSCSAIIASSLHGLIVADSYGIPNIRLKFGDNQPDTNDFKFRDYYSALGCEERASLFISPEDIAATNPAGFDTDYQKNIAPVQDKLHNVLLQFAEKIHKEHGAAPSAERDFDKLQADADEGDVLAMNTLGDLYYEGKSVPKSSAWAYQWYKAAADRGYHWGMFNLGKFYYEEAEYKNDDESRKWLKLAAYFGNFWAHEKLATWHKDYNSMQHLSDCYLNGYAEDRYIDQSEGRQKGKEWLKKAAEAELKASKRRKEIAIEYIEINEVKIDKLWDYS